jgi:hypothetical protein
VIIIKKISSGFIDWLKNNGVVYFGKIFMFGSTLTLAVIWFMAFFTGNKIIVTINDYNEAYTELILWLIGIPCIIFWIHAEYYGMKKSIYEHQKEYLN